MLTGRLTELRAAAILEKTSGGYQLIDQGRALLDTLAPLEQWAAAWQPAPSEP
ncbi:hypothetical protein [Actinoplanes sp. NPDC089786]|uniref:hypothetical protein n=1 Tax=Actinoplanes sp. NPDC089786 TaxID=3155185 RepID=UPI00343A4E63